MQTTIISIEYDTAFRVHILVQNPMQPVLTLLTDDICSPSKMTTVRKALEGHRLGELAQWFKNEYGLTHSKISISLGPEIRKWLKNLNKEKFSYENQNRKNFKPNTSKSGIRFNTGSTYKSTRKF